MSTGVLGKPLNAEEMKKLCVLTPRVAKRRKIWEEEPASVCPEGSLLFTKSWKETEGLPVDVRWARALEKKLLEGPIEIFEDELIVGSLTKRVKGVELMTAFRPFEIQKMLQDGRFSRQMSDNTSAIIDEEDMKLLREEADYWTTHLPPDYVNDAIRAELGEEHFELMNDASGLLEGPYLRKYAERSLFCDVGSWGGVLALHKDVLDAGLNDVLKTAYEELAKMTAEKIDYVTEGSEGYKKYHYIQAIIITCEAIIEWAHLYAKKARELAEKEANPTRKAELEQIAEICDWVPANPPRSYWEAVQSCRFVHLAVRKENPHRPENSIGRLDQLLYPYYKADVEAGKLDRQKAAELLGLFWLKTREGEILQIQPPATRITPGTNLPNITICGTDGHGHDQTNEISWLTLEVMRQMHLSEPAVYIRYSEGMDDDFLLYALECNKDMQGGIPAFLNDKMGAERYIARGIEVDDAYNWAASGCLSYHLDCSEHTGGSMHINQTKVLELVFNDGKDPLTGKQLGPHTGDPTKFKSFEELYDAFIVMEKWIVEQLRKDYAVRWRVDQEVNFQSGLGGALLYKEAIPKGMAPSRGGCKYYSAFTGWVGDRGTTDVADSLAATKYLVFEKKAVTMQQLLDAMHANWEGYEDIHQLCLKAPKYGNDDEYVDSIFRKVIFDTQHIIESKPDPFTGEKPIPFKGAASGHIIHGLHVGALPNGRVKGQSVNDAGTSAMPGMDVNGPTALVNSATCDDISWETFGNTHNMKFASYLFDSPEKLKKVLALVKVFFKRGGWHIQFNITDTADLKAAQKEPAKWKNLMVRVGGYSAYFVDLPESLQNEIIQRTEHSV